jgi:hypothetical protein
MELQDTTKTCSTRAAEKATANKELFSYGSVFLAVTWQHMISEILHLP